MSRVLQIAFATFKETVRRRIFVVSVGFAVLIFVVPIIAIPLAAGQKEVLVKDIGLSFIDVFGVVLAILMASSLVHDEIERKTVYTLLARPIRRRDYQIGKYLGLLLMSAANVGIMAVAFAAIQALALGGVDSEVMVAVGLSYLQVCVLTAVALLITTVSTPLIAIFVSVLVFLCGHLVSDLRLFGEQYCGPVGGAITKAVGCILPNLESFDVKGEVVYASGVSAQFVGLALLYAVCYSALAVFLSGFVFERREFK